MEQVLAGLVRPHDEPARSLRHIIFGGWWKRRNARRRLTLSEQSVRGVQAAVIDVKHIAQGGALFRTRCVFYRIGIGKTANRSVLCVVDCACEVAAAE